MEHYRRIPFLMSSIITVITGSASYIYDEQQ